MYMYIKIACSEQLNKDCSMCKIVIFYCSLNGYISIQV